MYPYTTIIMFTSFVLSHMTEKNEMDQKIPDLNLIDTDDLFKVCVTKINEFLKLFYLMYLQKFLLIKKIK